MIFDRDHSGITSLRGFIVLFALIVVVGVISSALSPTDGEHTATPTPSSTPISSGVFLIRYPLYDNVIHTVGAEYHVCTPDFHAHLGVVTDKRDSPSTGEYVLFVEGWKDDGTLTEVVLYVASLDYDMSTIGRSPVLTIESTSKETGGRVTNGTTQ